MPAGGTPHDPTAYHRYIEVLDSDAADQVLILSDRSTGVSLCKSANFELLRQGGCGGGDFTLLSRFPYDDITNGMYIRCKYTSDGDPVYLGRIEEITVDSPSTVTIRTEGPMSLLNNIRVGGFDSEDQRLPHLYAATDQFIYDPDWNLQSWDFTNTVPGLIQKLFDQYISIRTPITLGTIYSYPPSDTVAFNSSVFRGQETLGPLIRALAIQQLGASYGVDANNQFFFIPQNTAELAYFQEGRDLFKLQSSRDLSLLYNELHITGDYVYDLLNQNKLYKFYSTHASASSIAAYGPRKVTLYLPWIRTRADADAFASAFFNIYANVTTRYNLTTVAQGAVLVPWEGTLGLKDKDGADIVRAEPFDRIEHQWDHAAIPSVTIGPEDLQFPQAPDPGRWELANQQPQDFSFESSSVSDSSSSSSSSESSSSSDESDISTRPSLSDLVSESSSASSSSLEEPEPCVDCHPQQEWAIPAVGVCAVGTNEFLSCRNFAGYCFFGSFTALGFFYDTQKWGLCLPSCGASYMSSDPPPCDNPSTLTMTKVSGGAGAPATIILTRVA